jgi:hypothetical protein
MLMLPPVMAEYLRTGLNSELRQAVTEITNISSRGQRIPAPYRDPIYRMNAAKSLLDTIGWHSDQQVAGVRVDMRAYRALALAVLQRQLDVELDKLKNTKSAQRPDAERRVGELREFIADLQRLPAYSRDRTGG